MCPAHQGVAGGLGERAILRGEELGLLVARLQDELHARGERDDARGAHVGVGHLPGARQEYTSLMAQVAAAPLRVREKTSSPWCQGTGTQRFM